MSIVIRNRFAWLIMLANLLRELQPQLPPCYNLPVQCSMELKTSDDTNSASPLDMFVIVKISSLLLDLLSLMLLEKHGRPALHPFFTEVTHGPFSYDIPVGLVLIHAFNICDARCDLVDEVFELVRVPNLALAALRLGVLREGRRRLKVPKAVRALEPRKRSPMYVRFKVAGDPLHGPERFSIAARPARSASISARNTVKDRLVNSQLTHTEEGDNGICQYMGSGICEHHSWDVGGHEDQVRRPFPQDP